MFQYIVSYFQHSFIDLYAMLCILSSVQWTFTTSTMLADVHSRRSQPNAGYIGSSAKTVQPLIVTPSRYMERLQAMSIIYPVSTATRNRFPDPICLVVYIVSYRANLASFRYGYFHLSSRQLSRDLIAASHLRQLYLLPSQ